MIVAFDLDDVICNRPNDFESLGVEKYKYCVPIPEMINIVNSCYDNGHHIKIYTARGMSHFNGDVSKVYNELFIKTTEQLKEWGVKYHELIMGKTHYDLLIDDKALNSVDIKSKKDIDSFLNI